MATLQSQIEEEHLTCRICFHVFSLPKALPCLHTFCEHCIREYVASRGFETVGEFPCPICRDMVPIPDGGIEHFPNNHLVKSLSDTVDQSKPVPKPRRSLQPKPEESKSVAEMKAAEAAAAAQENEAPPPYTVASGMPSVLQVGAALPPTNYGFVDRSGNPSQPPPPAVQPQMYPPQQQSHPPPYYPQQVPPHTYPTPTPSTVQTPDARLQGMSINNPPHNPYRGAVLYPTIPPGSADPPPTPCSHGMLLQFGKKGAAITDFHKPWGLAVSDSCDFVVTDSDGTGNRIFVFDYNGRPKKAFQCDCRIRDVAVNGKNEIVVVVNKPAATFRCYDMSGRCLGEHGKSITHEEPNSIALMYNGGAVITGKRNSSVYILTDQYKLSSKFGRKGTGDGYFLSPAFVATDTKGHIIVTDDVNHSVQVFNSQGKFKLRFGGQGSRSGELFKPLGVATDANDNIVVADSGNFRVEMFTSKGSYLRTIVGRTEQLGEEVRPVNVALTPRGDIAVLLRGNYFAEVRVYSPLTICPSSSSASGQGVSVKDGACTTWYMVN